MSDKRKASVISTTPKSLGDFPVLGWYTVFTLILSESIMLPQMANISFMVFGGYSPTVTSCGDVTFRNNTAPDHCAAVAAVVAQTNCIPELTAQFESVAMEFGRYCDGMIDVKTSISIQMFGVLLGAVTFGQLSDHFGRRKILFICSIGMFAFDLAASYASSLNAFTALMLGAMFFTGGNSTVSHVFLMEMVPKKDRVWTTMIVSYSPNYIIMSIIAYFMPNWRSLLTFITLTNLLTLLLLWAAYESPRYFVQKGALAEAKRTYEKIERLNGSASVERQLILDQLIEKEVVALEERRSGKRHYIYHLFYTWDMVTYTAAFSYSLFVTSMLVYALMFNMEKLSGSLYWNNVILGFIRYSFNLVASVVDLKLSIGRKFVHKFAVLWVAGPLLGVFVIKFWDISLPMLSNVLTLIGTAMCSQLFVVVLVANSELFPTPIRNTSSSFQQIFTRLGSVMSPHFFYFTNFWTGAPYLFMVVLMLLNGGFFWWAIPETKGTPMQDHMPPKHQRIWRHRNLETGDVGATNLVKNGTSNDGVV
uniref:MFS domain-containing protein n=1 Tax=Panagrellus redivivus TaxID=6233 RepID=A0A7E4VIF4_PANRE